MVLSSKSFLEFKINTLTPIWTGDIEGKCTKLRETSILGSLRWWFEAIVRGFGGYACSPTTNNKKCPKDGKNLPLEKKICTVCYIFGSTGWTKRFRFEINQSFRKIYDGNLVFAGSKRNWYYPSGLCSYNTGKNVIKFINPTWRINDKIELIFRVLFLFISNWGMIGGKTAIGYGVVEFEFENSKLNDSEIKEFFEYLEEKRNAGVNAENAPKLNEMFFVKFKVKENCLNDIIKKVDESVNVRNGKKEYPKKIYKCNGTEEHPKTTEEFLKKLNNCYGFIPVSPLIRRELRKIFRKEYVKQNKDKIPDWLRNLSENDALQKLRHFLMGELGRFSAINVSHIYWNNKQWEFRIWGWIPENISEYVKISNSSISRKDVVDFLKKLFNSELFNSQDFWKNIFGANCVEKSDKANYIVEYPKSNWNFIDLGEVEDIERAFKDMICDDEK